jgi:hypothetical protein
MSRGRDPIDFRMAILAKRKGWEGWPRQSVSLPDRGEAAIRHPPIACSPGGSTIPPARPLRADASLREDLGFSRGPDADA